MLVTDRGQVIRIPVDDIRIAGRNTQGVTLFDVAEGEHVVSVARLTGAAEANGAEAGDEGVADSDGDGADGGEVDGDAPDGDLPDGGLPDGGLPDGPGTDE
jgi:DNA gyrase subunit A